MRHPLTILSLVIALLLPVGCGGGVDSDMELKPEELKEVLESLSVAELEERIAEVEKRTEELGKEVGDDDEPSEAQLEELGKLTGLGLAYAMALGAKKGG